MTARDELIQKLEGLYCRPDHRRGDVNEVLDHYINEELAIFREHSRRDELKIKQLNEQLKRKNNP